MSRPLLVLLGLLAVVLTVLSNRYGYYNDEMYFLVSGKHPAWGYPDQPPLTPMLARLGDALAPGQVWALRLPATASAVLTVLFVALSAREMGASRRAELLAATAFSCSTLVLITGHVLRTSTTDLCFTAALTWLLCRLIRTRNDKLWLVIGLVLGVGLLNKMLLALWALAVLAALLLTGPRRILHSRWLPPAALLATAFWTPYLLWQANHHWPQFEMASVLRTQGSPIDVLTQQLIIGPLLLPLCIAGATWLWRTQYRFFTLAFIAFAALLIATGGKATYLAGAYPALFAAAGIATDHWLSTRRRTVLLYGVLGLSLLAAAPVGLPLLPERAAVDYGNALGFDQARGQSGWPAVADATAAAMHQLTPAERDRAVVYAYSYTQASAIELFGPERGLPTAYSGHNAFANWPRPPDSADIVLIVTDSTSAIDAPAWTYRACDTIGPSATVATPIATRERDRVIWTCHLREPWSALWPRLARIG